MRTKNPRQKKLPKFRLLLDSAFAKPGVFEKTIKKASIKHVRHDYNLAPETEDETIYQLATQENMFVVTLDLGFKKLIKKNGAGVLMLSSGLPNTEIDARLSEFISGKNPQDYKGKATRI